MSIKHVRMSRKDHRLPIDHGHSARVAAKFSNEQRPRQPEKPHSVHSTVPKKQWPDMDLTTITPPPTSYARDGQEGPVRGHQADKSSRTT